MARKKIHMISRSTGKPTMEAEEIMMGIIKYESLREMANRLNRSLGSLIHHLQMLERHQLVVHLKNSEARKAYQLTENGRKYMENTYGQNIFYRMADSHAESDTVKSP